MDEADDELSILKGLGREGLLSDKQFEKLVQLDVSDLPAVALVIKDTKVGQGVKILHNTIKSLRESLGTLSKELIDTGSAVIKTQLIPVLEELHRRTKGITDKQHATVKRGLHFVTILLCDIFS